MAELIPLPRRPRYLPWNELMGGAEKWRADSSLSDELRELLPETTDDVAIA